MRAPPRRCHADVGGAWLAEAAERAGRRKEPGSGFVGEVAVSIEIGSMGSSCQHDSTSAPGDPALVTSFLYVKFRVPFIPGGFVVNGQRIC